MKKDCRMNVYGHALYLRPLLTLLLLFLFISGCTRSEPPKKVSLYKKSGEIVRSDDHLQPNTLWFGFDLRLGPKEEIRIYTPFLKYLERATGKRFRIKFTERYEDTVDNLGKGITHFASLGTLNYVIGADRYGIRYLVSGVNKEGDTSYHAAIIARPDSPVHDLKDLKGKCFAFGAEKSTQGHLIPRRMLEDGGTALDDLGKYIYTGSHINTVKAVLNDECDAGGIQDTLANTLASEGKIKVIKISEPYPSSVIAYNTSVDKKIVAAVRSALLAFDPAGRHKDILFDWEKTEMPLGFSKINELELNKVMSLAKDYRLLEE